jgi:hypothetical protein
MTRKTRHRSRPPKRATQAVKTPKDGAKKPTLTRPSERPLRGDRGQFVAATPSPTQPNTVLDEAAAAVLDREANRRLWRRIRDNKKAPYAQRLKASEMLERDFAPAPPSSRPMGGASADDDPLAATPDAVYMDMLKASATSAPTPPAAPAPEGQRARSAASLRVFEQLGRKAEQTAASGPLRVTNATPTPPPVVPTTPMTPPPVPGTPPPVSKVVDATAARPVEPPPQAQPDPEVQRIARTMSTEHQTPAEREAIRRRAEQVADAARSHQARNEAENEVARKNAATKAQKMREQGLE